MDGIKNIVICILAALLIFSWVRPRQILPTTARTDTLVVRDTIRETVFVPKLVHLVRVDTVWLRPFNDTVAGEGLEYPPSAFRLPIERKTYQTEDYRAVVEGFRPHLIGLELYPKTLVVTPRPRRWGVGIQTGVGITSQGVTPYIGVGVQYNILFFR